MSRPVSDLTGHVRILPGHEEDPVLPLPGGPQLQVPVLANVPEPGLSQEGGQFLRLIGPLPVQLLSPLPQAGAGIQAENVHEIGADPAALLILRPPDAIGVLRLVQKDLPVQPTQLGRRIDVEQEQPAAQKPQADASYRLERTPLPETLKSNEGDKTLTPAQVYKMNIGAVCGISTQVTADLWGVETTGICTGSGFVLTEDGYIVTNHHVIADADEGTVVVQFYSGEEYPAAIVGTDSMNDIALLKIEAEGLQTVTVGDSDEVEVGETVEAIGNPLGDLTFTMTAGYISALDREIDTDGTVINMLQTDAAINSGNSGGPLFDMNGNIIGVTTAKVSGTTETGVTIEGLGFAIPINDVLRVVYDLQQYGRVRGRAYLGVTLQNLDAEVAEIYGLPSGPQVVTVTEGSCSEKAGLQPHDIILEFDGREINAYSDLVSALSKHRAGDTVKLKLYRAGAEIEVTLTLDERPGEEEINEAEQQAQNELEGQSGQEEEFTVPDFDGYGYDYGG